MNFTGETQLYGTPGEGTPSAAERAAQLSATGVIVRELCNVSGLEPSQALTLDKIAGAAAQRRAGETTIALGPVLIGTVFLGLLADSDRGYIDPDTITRLTEPTGQLPKGAQEPGTKSVFIKEGVAPHDVVDMIRNALATEGSEQ